MSQPDQQQMPDNSMAASAGRSRIMAAF